MSSKRWLKCSVKSVSSVRERNTLCEGRNSMRYVSGPVGVTSHTNKQLAPPPTPPPKGRGVITEIPLWAGCRLLVAPYRYLR